LWLFHRELWKGTVRRAERARVERPHGQSPRGL
jgi:hypothetical protein